MKNSTIKLIVAFALSALLTILYLYIPAIFFSMDNRLRDFMFIARGELPKSNNVIIVDIDEKSLQRYGQWPWSRDIVAKLISGISQYSPGIIGLDIIFPEEDRSSPHRVLKNFPEIKQALPNNDKILEESFRTFPVIGGYLFAFDSRGSSDDTPVIPAVFIQRGLSENHTILEPSSIILNTEILQNSLYSSGFLNSIPDENGMIRRAPLIMKYHDSIYPSQSLELIRVFSAAQRMEIYGDTIGTQGISFGDFDIPIDRSGTLFINFRGPKGHYRYISASDILDGNRSIDGIGGKFILLGTSALGLSDIRSTVYDSAIPGVEIHANIIDNILTGDFLYTPPDHVLYDILTIWILVFIFMVIFNYIRSVLLLPIALLILYLLAYGYFNLLFGVGIVLSTLFPILTFILTLILSVTIDYIKEQKNREQVKRLLEKKVSSGVMNYLIDNPAKGLVDSREVEATVFFSDIEGFTSISETIGSPDRLIKMLNTYMTPMVDSIVKYQGTIDKFIGDAIMAYWNAPLNVNKHADMALMSAIEQIEMLEEINRVVHHEYGVNINIGIGLHTGLVTVGDMGSEGRSDYTVIGDNVNIASRLEGLTREYDIQILISGYTYALLENIYKIRPIDIVKVKGRSQSIEIFEVVPKTKSISSEEWELYMDGIMLFREKEYKKAVNSFSILIKKYPSKLYTIYYNRSKDLEADSITIT